MPRFTGKAPLLIVLIASLLISGFDAESFTRQGNSQGQGQANGQGQEQANNGQSQGLAVGNPHNPENANTKTKKPPSSRSANVRPEGTPATVSSNSDTSKLIPNQYIVVLNKDAPVATEESILGLLPTGLVNSLGRRGLRGLVVKIPPGQLNRILNNPNIAFVEQDQIAQPQVVQSSPPNWGLDRIDQANLPLNSQYVYTLNGAGVRAYVVDSGIFAAHTDFGGRVTNGFDFVDNDAVAQDCFGHGTHVASVLGGATYGVAKNVSLVALRVFDCSGSGSYSQVIAAMNWVANNAVKPAVVNLSLGGGTSDALDAAINTVTALGIPVVVAAGNFLGDSCTISPARVPAAFTIAASTITDTKWALSNTGTCVDLWAPGSDITAASITSSSASNSASGTSEAAPMASGVVAQILQNNPTSSVAQINSVLTLAAILNKISNPGNSPNLLLSNLVSVSTTSPPPTTTRPPTTTTRSPTTTTRAPTPAPGSGILNGNFEAGGANWVQTSAAGYVLIDSYGASFAHSGTFSAYLAGYNGATDVITQTVTIGAGANVLRYWVFLQSAESSTLARDTITVRLLNDSTQAVLTSFTRFSNLNARGVWLQDVLSLSTFNGQRVRLQIVAATDATDITDFFIDDVSLGAS